MNISRIPEFSDHSVDGMLLWFATMSERELLFHPDDLPKDIIIIATGEPTFSPGECKKTADILDAMFELHGDDVYEAAYPVFMQRMGIRLDA
jgi:hypothetical protein